MGARHIQINALVEAIASAIRIGGDAQAAATATGLRRAVWATLTATQQAQVLAAAQRRAARTRGVR